MIHLTQNPRKFIYAMLLMTLLLLVPTGCRQKPKRVVIGVAISVAYHPGVELAAKEINAHGGVKGTPLELMGMDWKVIDQYDAQDVLSWAKRFDENKDLVAVIGHSDSTSTLSAAAYYNQHRIPQIVTIATNPAITNIGSWTYRLCLSDAEQGPALAGYVVNDWGKKRIAVFYANDDYGRGLANLFEHHVRELGGEIVSSFMHHNVLQQEDEESMRSVLTNLKKNGEPDLFVLFQRMAAGHWTLDAIRQAGLHTDVLGGDNLGSLKFARAWPKLTEGIRVSQFFWPQRDDPQTMRFVQDLSNMTHEPLDYGDAFAYDAVYLLREAIESGGFSRDGVKSSLDRIIREEKIMKGVAGSYIIAQDHDARRALYVVEFHDGEERMLKALKVN
jgi:branched-chain amino acid transport system substrate-binding protein